ncbi:unnamed protein product [Rotaria magnacalcarata]|uniref:Phosphatidic acid phosphatase type 2/haloperoxidase domain-containing protein n=5 Tax=Rotaria magnacalcarata TaxID=392030 RepID=A0A820B5J3_9BILA|nr:unnamed protein product [Rotaria magnacalcarata]CAF4195776.1 unnamed protein product [Rotaria magnacalcarata]
MQYKLIIVLACFVTSTICATSGSTLKNQASTLLDQLNSQKMDVILFWNAVLIRAGANDYDTSIVATPDQAGPTTTSRAFAIIHGAMYEAMNAFERTYKPLFNFINMPKTNDVLSNPAVEAAVTAAAYQTLVSLYPTQKTLFDEAQSGFLNTRKKDLLSQLATVRGTAVGYLVASTILSNRRSDHSQDKGVYTPIMQPGYHQADPTHPSQSFLSPQWGNVKPFVIRSGSQFRASNIVGQNVAQRLQYINSQNYINDYNEVVRLGSLNSAYRTADQTEIGIFWGYDGAPKIGVPPRLYNQVVRVIAIQKKNTVQQNARLFALANYAMADAAISAWESKYYYGLWRPIVAIRQGTRNTRSIPNWLPLGAPADGSGINFTPGFPSYVSGHATFGGAVFGILRLFYGTDTMKFQLQSDEYNGITKDSVTNKIRPVRTRYYQSFTQAEDENFLSRIYLGVHWRLDQEAGRTMGRQIASYVFTQNN